MNIAFANDLTNYRGIVPKCVAKCVIVAGCGLSYKTSLLSVNLHIGGAYRIKTFGSTEASAYSR